MGQRFNGGRVAVRRSCTAVAATLIGLATIACGGCAYSYVDEQGATHAIGLMSVVVHRPPQDGPIAGDVVGITTIGVAAGSNAQGGYLALGYSRQTTAALRDDVVVKGNPVEALNGR